VYRCSSLKGLQIQQLQGFAHIIQYFLKRLKCVDERESRDTPQNLQTAGENSKRFTNVPKHIVL